MNTEKISCTIWGLRMEVLDEPLERNDVGGCKGWDIKLFYAWFRAARENLDQLLVISSSPDQILPRTSWSGDHEDFVPVELRHELQLSGYRTAPHRPA